MEQDEDQKSSNDDFCIPRLVNFLIHVILKGGITHCYISPKEPSYSIYEHTSPNVQVSADVPLVWTELKFLKTNPSKITKCKMWQCLKCRLRMEIFHMHNFSSIFHVKYMHIKEFKMLNMNLVLILMWKNGMMHFFATFI